MKTILTEEYYGRLLEVEINMITQTDLTFIPDEVKETVHYNMADNATEGEFDSTEFGYTGKWRFLELDYELMLKIALYRGNFSYPSEALTEELFIQHFGENYGHHFYHKWIGEINRDFFLMMAYFRSNHKYGQEFCNMYMEQVNKYTQRDK